MKNIVILIFLVFLCACSTANKQITGGSAFHNSYWVVNKNPNPESTDLGWEFRNDVPMTVRYCTYATNMKRRNELGLSHKGPAHVALQKICMWRKGFLPVGKSEKEFWEEFLPELRDVAPYLGMNQEEMAAIDDIIEKWDLE